jgi:hypothetical protein
MGWQRRGCSSELTWRRISEPAPPADSSLAQSGKAVLSREAVLVREKQANAPKRRRRLAHNRPAGPWHNAGWRATFCAPSGTPQEVGTGEQSADYVRHGGLARVSSVARYGALGARSAGGYAQTIVQLLPAADLLPAG